jgi:hypothetical protein
MLMLLCSQRLEKIKFNTNQLQLTVSLVSVKATKGNQKKKKKGFEKESVCEAKMIFLQMKQIKLLNFAN